MTIPNIKKRMLAYRDFYGGDLLNSSDIEAAKTKKDLNEILEKHRSHMECMLSDALSHLDNFKRQIKVPF